MDQKIIEQLNWRYATKQFDSSKKVSQQQLDTLLEAGRLSASSFGLQPWKLVVVTNPDVRAKLKEAAWGQPQITDSTALIVLCSLREMSSDYVERFITLTAEIRGMPKEALDGYKQSILGSISGKSKEQMSSWMGKQTYIALGTLLETAALMEIDACPMEGFDNAKFDEILGLEKMNLHSEALCSVGYRNPADPMASAKKVRFSKEDLIVEVK